MKKLIIAMAIAIPAICFAAYEGAKNSATVTQQKGVYIFVDSAPVAEYDYLGEVNTGMFGGGSGQYLEVKTELLDRCKKKFPTANGLIFHFVTGEADRADAILIK